MLVVDIINLVKRKHKYLSVKSSLVKGRPRSSVCYSRGGPNRMSQSMIVHTSDQRPVEVDDFRKSARLMTVKKTDDCPYGKKYKNMGKTINFGSTFGATHGSGLHHEHHKK